LAKDYAFGWTDLNLIRHADKINKLSSIMLTHLDVLNDLDVIKIAEKYTLNQSD
jgi:adenylosuccinate synthase